MPVENKKIKWRWDAHYLDTPIVIVYKPVVFKHTKDNSCHVVHIDM